DLFSQLIALTHEQVGRRAFRSQLRLLGLGLRCLRIGFFTGQRDVLGDHGAKDLTLVDATLTLPREVQFTNAEEESQDVAVPRVPEGPQQRRRRELLL